MAAIRDMGNISPPTAADYANNTAQNNRQELNRLSLRLKELEKSPSEVNESAETIKTLLSENAELRAEVAALNEELLEWLGYHPPQVGIWKEVGPPENWNNPL